MQKPLPMAGNPERLSLKTKVSELFSLEEAPQPQLFFV